MIAAKSKFLREEAGFTLAELMVTMMIMITVLFALYSIFDMSIRVFSFGNDKVEAVENARLGLAKIERELRAAHPVDKANNAVHLFFSANGVASSPPQAMPASDQITFGNDLDGDRKISCPNTKGNCEYITYRLNSSDSTLLRNNTANGSDPSTGGDPVVEYVNGATGLKFTYLDKDGDPCGSSNPECTGTDEGQIRMVRVELTINKDDRIQTLTTDVALRNRMK